MEYPLDLENRKNNHININLHKDVNSSNTTGLKKFRLVHSALPEINLDLVDTSTALFGKILSMPLQISSMTGGTKTAQKLNRIFALAAETHQIAFGVGSQRMGIEYPEKMDNFKVRAIAPNAMVFANLGAVQLNYGFDESDCQRAVDEIGADALILHLNPLQEALMEHGDTNFSGLLKRIELVAKRINTPLIVKEVGWGINRDIAKKLFNAGVSAVDIAGAGGTSWSQVEMHRAGDEHRKKVAEIFHVWGIPTADALIAARDQNQKDLIFASGGLVNGIDIVKCLALGANLCGMARPFLKYAARSSYALDRFIDVLKAQIRVAMFSIGALTIHQITRDLITMQEN